MEIRVPVGTKGTSLWKLNIPRKRRTYTDVGVVPRQIVNDAGSFFWSPQKSRILLSQKAESFSVPTIGIYSLM